MSFERRQRANLLGLRAETLAVLLLRLKGWRILARNYKVPGGEIDIVALRGQVVAFVEVKARPTMDGALSAIDATKRRRISRAASQWLTQNGWAMSRTLRGDAICIAPGCWPRHEVAVVEMRMG